MMRNKNLNKELDIEDYEELENLIKCKFDGIDTKIVLDGIEYSTEMYPDEMYNLRYGKTRKEFFHEKRYAVRDLSTDRLKRFDETKLKNDELLKNLETKIYPLWEKKIDKYFFGLDSYSTFNIWKMMIFNKLDKETYFDRGRFDYSDSYLSSTETATKLVEYYNKIIKLLDLAEQGKIDEAKKAYFELDESDAYRIYNSQLYLRSSRFAPELEDVMEKDIIESSKKGNFDYNKDYNYCELKRCVSKVKKSLEEEKNKQGQLGE